MTVGLSYHRYRLWQDLFSCWCLGWLRGDQIGETWLAKNSGITSTRDVVAGRIERSMATYVRETPEGCGEFLCRPPGVRTRLAAIDHVHWRCGARGDLF